MCQWEVLRLRWNSEGATGAEKRRNTGSDEMLDLRMQRERCCVVWYTVQFDMRHSTIEQAQST
jgi:hypothetical protein